jgi:hypothetical protein
VTELADANGRTRPAARRQSSAARARTGTRRTGTTRTRRSLAAGFDIAAFRCTTVAPAR